MDPYPEATPLLASLSSSMKAGGINSKDAAAQLVALLKHKESQQGRMQSLLAAGRAPPGFAVPQGSQQPPPGLSAPSPPLSSPTPPSSQPGGPPNSNGLLTPLDSPVIPTPSIGRYQPIGKPIGPPVQPQQPQSQQLPPEGNGNELGHHPSLPGAGAAPQPPSQYANGLGMGTYSMWSGLPGIDHLAPTYSPLGSSMWSGLGSCAPPGVDPLQPNQGTGFAHQPMPSPHQAPAPATSRPPPPGFGGPAYTPAGLLDSGAGAANKGGAAGYQPLGALPNLLGVGSEARYNPLNPLNFQAASSSQQFSGYRPQLL